METKQRRRPDFSKLRGVKPQTVNLSGAVVERTFLEPGRALPLVYRPATADVDVVDWSTKNRRAIDQDCVRHGAVLFRGFGVDAVDLFDRLASALCNELFNENGEHPRESVNRNVYTPVFFPPDQKLLWHNENSFNQRWPRKIIFCCVRPADVGGETPLVDSRELFRRLPDAIRADFQSRQVMYRRNYGTGLGRDWPDVFQTENPAEVEARCKADGIEMAWKDGGQRLSTWAVRPAIVRHPDTGEMSWFNQAQHWHVSCVDDDTRKSMEAVFAAEDMPRSCHFGDGSPIPDQVMGEILDHYRQLEVSFPWQRGDVLVVDNISVAHARNPFAGERKLLVALGDMMSFAQV
jgi:alpha-ketoglutarate-dependent taurine dioxygenase